MALTYHRKTTSEGCSERGKLYVQAIVRIAASYIYKLYKKIFTTCVGPKLECVYPVLFTSLLEDLLTGARESPTESEIKR